VCGRSLGLIVLGLCLLVWLPVCLFCLSWLMVGRHLFRLLGTLIAVQ
jgi:hypothetical protein